eukprot:407632-Pelagomonas_calceolata.AAC.1
MYMRKRKGERGNGLWCVPPGTSTRTWAYTNGSCQIQNGLQEIGAGVYCPLTGNRSFVEPNDAGITNTIMVL